MSDARADRVGLAGYGCLALLAVGGALAGTTCLVVGIGGLVAGGEERLKGVDDAARLVDSLQGVVALTGAGALAFLVAVVASIVLLKELADEEGRRRRGPARREEGPGSPSG